MYDSSSHPTTVIAGVIGVIGIVIGGAIAAVSAYFTAQVQFNNQNKLARDDLVLQQKQIAYASSLNDDDSLRLITDALMRAWIGNLTNPKGATDIGVPEAKYDAAHLKLGSDYNAIRIVGSDLVVSDMTSLLAVTINQVGQMNSTVQSGVSSRAKITQLQSVMRQYDAEQATAHEKLADDERSEFAGPGPGTPSSS